MRSDPLDGDAAEKFSSPNGPVDDDAERWERLREVLTCFSHRCRNSLNGIKMSLYLFKRGLDGQAPECLNGLDRLYRDIERSFDQFRVIYRPLSVTVIRHPLGRLITERVPSWREWFGERGRCLDVEPPDHDPAGDFDPIYLGLGLDAFVAWRAEAGFALSRPRLSWSVTDDRFYVNWEEAHEQSGNGSGSHPNGCAGGRATIPYDSLALSLLVRIVAAHGGRLERTGDHAITIRMHWPRFQGCAVDA